MKLNELHVREQAIAGSFIPQHIIVHGDSKTGKTELVGQLATKFNLHWFDLENGSNTLLKLPQSAQENINIFKIPDTRSYPVGIDTMLKVITGAPVQICRPHGKVSCLLCKDQELKEQFCLHELGPNDIFVIDSGTQLGVSAINHLTRNKDDEYRPDWDDWRRQGFMLDRFLSNLQQGHYHAIVITHTTKIHMEDDAKAKLMPVIGTDNFSRTVARYFDHVVNCDLGIGKHSFGSSTLYKPLVLTGSRTDVKIEAMDKPSLLPFFEPKITGAITWKEGMQPPPNPAASKLATSLPELKQQMLADQRLEPKSEVVKAFEEIVEKPAMAAISALEKARAKIAEMQAAKAGKKE